MNSLLSEFLWGEIWVNSLYHRPCGNNDSENKFGGPKFGGPMSDATLQCMKTLFFHRYSNIFAGAELLEIFQKFQYFDADETNGR